MSRSGYIYRLTCVNPTIKDRYIGSCWDLHTRNRKHRSRCHNDKSKEYNAPVYKFIRDNGGYDNWYMVTLDCVDCEDHELVEYEQHYIDIHGGIDFLLNHINAVRDKARKSLQDKKRHQRDIENKRFYCECCDKAFRETYGLQRHFKTEIHKQTQQTYDFLGEIDNSNIF